MLRSDIRRAHSGAIAAWDVLSVEVLTLQGLVRYHLLIVISLASHRFEIGGIVREPIGAWMMQAVRNLRMAVRWFASLLPSAGGMMTAIVFPDTTG